MRPQKGALHVLSKELLAHQALWYHSGMETEAAILLDGKKLKRLREERKLTQLCLATAIEVSTETISRWENNKSPTIKRENAQRLVHTLGVSLGDLARTEEIEVEAPDSDPQTQDLVAPRSPRWQARIPVTGWLGLALLLLAGSFAWSFFPAITGQHIRASRYLPPHTLPTGRFPVLIRLEQHTSPNPFMLRESLPKKTVAVEAIPQSINQRPDASELKWITTGERQNQPHLVYLVEPRSVQIGDQLTFSGTIIAGRRAKAEPTVTGHSITEISVFHWADENRDNRIDDYEMLSIFDLYPEAVQLGIDLEEIKDIWASNGYRWNTDRGGIEIFGHPKGNEHTTK